MNTKNSGNIQLILICILVGIGGRILPHPTNVSPLTNLSLFMGMHWRWKRGFFVVSLCHLLSDFLLFLIKDYPFCGSWSIFTYSSILGMVGMGSLIHTTNLKTIYFYVFSSSMGFWLWTNFGVWLMDNVYAKDFSGLLACYQLALPFLRNSLLGDFLWMMVIFGLGLRILYFKNTRVSSNQLQASKMS